MSALLCSTAALRTTSCATAAGDAMSRLHNLNTQRARSQLRPDKQRSSLAQDALQDITGAAAKALTASTAAG
jgi:hypothetical protein